MDKKPTKSTKEKRRNSEKRKEKSRDAARSRRTRETEIFNDLASALPLAASTVSQLDKASIMRLALSYLKVRSLVKMVPLPTPVLPRMDCSNDQLFLRALEGFLLVISADGDFVFISENIQDYLGIPQIELMGQSIFEFSHPCDHDEIKEILSVKSQQATSLPCSFFIRLKSTLTSKGRNVNLKSASYKVIHCTGHLLGSESAKLEAESDEEDSNCPSEPQHCLVAIGEPIPHPSNIEIPLDKQTFLSKHTLDMKFTYADDKIGDFLGYNSDDLIGKSVYEYYHAMDSAAVEKGFKILFAKGQCETGRYRFLAKNGGYVWVLTQATLIYGSKGQKPHSVVCVNFVISGVEHQDEIYSCIQLTSPASSQPGIELAPVSPTLPFFSRPKVVTSQIFAQAPSPTTPLIYHRPQAVTAKLFPQAPVNPPSYLPTQVTTTPPYPRPHTVTASLFRSAPVSPNYGPNPHLVNTKAGCSPGSPQHLGRVSPQQTTLVRPQLATSKIFAPRTEDMNKGFLMFADDDTGLTMLKEEPEDLTHLAPTAGDVCVPLENNLFVTDMFDDFMLGDNYCPLLVDDMIASDDTGSKSSGDPFFSYRDDSSMIGSPSNDLSRSSQLLSSSLNKSPERRSLPSLCSPGGSTDDDMTHMMSLNVDTDGDEELSMRAPYIPMSEGDDLPLLISADLMWGPLAPDLEQDKEAQAKNNSCLEELLRDKSPSLPRADCQLIKPGDLVDPADVFEQIYLKKCPRVENEWLPSVSPPSEESPSNSPQQKGSPKPQKRSLDDPTLSERERKRGKTTDPYTGGGCVKQSKEEPPGGSQLLRQLIQAQGPTPLRSKTAVFSETGQRPPQSDSVLMNLLVSGCDDELVRLGAKRKLSPSTLADNDDSESVRKRSLSLLDSYSKMIPLLYDLNQRDYDVNAPLYNNSRLLQGHDLLTALEASNVLE